MHIETVAKKLAELGPKALLDTMALMALKQHDAQVQDNEQANYGGLFTIYLENGETIMASMADQQI